MGANPHLGEAPSEDMEAKRVGAIRDWQRGEDGELREHPDHADADACRDLGGDILCSGAIHVHHGHHAEAEKRYCPADVVLWAVTLYGFDRPSRNDSGDGDGQGQREDVDA